MKRSRKYKKRKKYLFFIILPAVLILLAAAFYNFYIVQDHPTEAMQIYPDASNNINENTKGLNSPLPASTTAGLPSPGPDCLPSKYNFVRQISDGKRILDNFKRSYDINFTDAVDYTDVRGITCFRGNNYRDSASYGFADVKEKKLEKVWHVKNGYIDEWTGVGWNGQPAIVNWKPEIRNIMNIIPSKKQKEDLKEVIYASLDGKIYFLDLDDGKATRPAINAVYPYKGSVTIDPRGYPLLYAGQGINVKNGEKVPCGYRIFSLIDQKLLYFIDGLDPYAKRRWPAFDSGSLIDKQTDSFIECGENGVLYTMKLNTAFDLEKGTISIKPDMIKSRYDPVFRKKIGTENSPVIYKNYIYFADNGGLLQCVDLNTLAPVWIRNLTDDTDSTMVLEDNGNGEIYLYTANEVDLQGAGGSTHVRKINALTGDLVWEKSYKCYYDPHTNGGALASPISGKNDIKDLVIYNMAKTGTNNNKGKLIAFDKNTGSEKWTVDFDFYSWSSPVSIYTKEGKSYLILCDSRGYMYLLEGISGKILDSIDLGSNIEASPAVYENMIVVGTRGQKIWGVKIK